jgi:hypothetical protein
MWFQLLLTKLIMVLSFMTNAHYLDFAVESGETHDNMSPKIYAFLLFVSQTFPLLLNEPLYKRMTFSSWENPAVLTS